jgi:hypothetical protein
MPREFNMVTLADLTVEERARLEQVLEVWSEGKTLIVRSKFSFFSYPSSRPPSSAKIQPSPPFLPFLLQHPSASDILSAALSNRPEQGCTPSPTFTAG